jgi:hypothetical protein
MKKFIPIGSVVSLRNSEKRLMITGYRQQEIETDKVWDYCACLFPEGSLNVNQAILFDEGQIDKLFFVGLQDTECLVFHEQLSLSLENSQELNAPNEQETEQPTPTNEE